MVRKNLQRESIPHAVYGITENTDIQERSVDAIRQSVVMRILSAAGWDIFNTREVWPDYSFPRANADFMLMVGDTPTVYIDVRDGNDSMDNIRRTQYMLSRCVNHNIPMTVTTNGRKWEFYSTIAGNFENRLFAEFDIAGKPADALVNFQRFMAYQRVISGEAITASAAIMRENNYNQSTHKAVMDGWNQVVGRLDEGLVEMVATAIENKTGERIENRVVRRILVENMRNGGNTDTPPIEKKQLGAKRNRTKVLPASFALNSEPISTEKWSDMLVQLCLLMRERHPENFHRILNVRGIKRPYFSTRKDDILVPVPVGDTGIFAACQGPHTKILSCARQVVQTFGYSPEDLVVTTQ